MLPARNHDLHSCLDRIDRLGVFPEVAHRILRVTQSVDATMADLESAVSIDPVLTARVLQVANSPLYGLSQKIGTLRRAVQMLGMEGTRGVAFALAVSAMGSQGGQQARALYDRAIATAATTRLLAPHVAGIHAGMMFAAALVHDLGLQLLLIVEGDATRELLSKLGHNRTLVRAERFHFGFDHAQLGGEGLRRWGLPEPAAMLVASHHDPIRPHQRSRALLQIADHVGEGVIHGDLPWQIADRGRDHALAPLLSVPGELWDELAEQLPGVMRSISG